MNLRMPEEMARVGFDEAALVKELDAFAEAMAAADGKMLLHCTTAWRASHLWAAYLLGTAAAQSWYIVRR